MTERRRLVGKKYLVLFFASVALSVLFIALTVRFIATEVFYIVEIFCLAFTVFITARLFKDVRLTSLFCILSLFFPVSSLLFCASALSFGKKTKRKLRANGKTNENFSSSFTATEYYPTGEEFFKSLMLGLENAKELILLEYYIVKPGKVWESIKNVLEKKSRSGVKIIIILDNFGSAKMPQNLQKWLKSHNIECFLYNRLLPLPNLGFTFRTHRKIAVIDDEVYLGGINLADEYINEGQSFAYFKDAAVKLKGETAARFAEYFSAEFKAVTVQNTKNKCDVLFNTPLTNNAITERIIAEIYKAKQVLIATPYLAPTEGELSAIKYAAKNGAEVKIFLPAVPDKKTAFSVSLANAEILLRYGLKIYLFTPGFLHSKLFLTENVAAAGSANYDYRSAFFQREVFVFTDEKTLSDKIKNDFSMIEKSSSVFSPDAGNKSKTSVFFMKIKRAFFFFISPLF